MNCTFCQDKLTLLRHELDQARICCEKFAPLGSVFESPFMSNFSWLVAVPIMPDCTGLCTCKHNASGHSSQLGKIIFFRESFVNLHQNPIAFPSSLEII